MSNVAKLIVGHSFVKAHATTASVTESKSFLLARSGHKDALSYLLENQTSIDTDKKLRVQLVFAPSYLKVFQPSTEKIAFFGDSCHYQRPILSYHCEPLVASHLCLPSTGTETTEEIQAKLDLHQIRDVVVSTSLATAAWVDGLRGAGFHITLAGPTASEERAALLSAHLNCEWRSLLGDVELSTELRPLDSVRAYFQMCDGIDGVVLDPQDFFAFNKELKMATLSSRWGELAWNDGWFYRTQTQATSFVEHFDGLHLLAQSREAGFWPGPVSFGRSVQLTLWDFFDESLRAQLDIVGSQEASGSAVKIQQLLSAMGRGLTTESAFQSVKHQLQTELAMARGFGQIKDLVPMGLLHGVLK
jgi:hypothetical protein